MAASKKPIRIKPANKGKLHADLNVAPGKKISTSKLSKAKKKSTDPAEQKRITFAQNAKKWNKKK